MVIGFRTKYKSWFKYLILSLVVCLFDSQLSFGQNADQPLFDDMNKPLFNEPLFADEGNTKQGNEPAAQSPANNTIDMKMENAVIDRKIEEASRRAEQKLQESRANQILEGQIDKVCSWLQQYAMMTYHTFPGYVSDEMHQAQIQLTELVPNNPYNPGTTPVVGGESGSFIFGSSGFPYEYNANGTPRTGSPSMTGEWSVPAFQQVQDLDRIRLSINQSLTRNMIDYWTTDPPDDWVAPPGTITATGNNQGLFIVWGAGRDGKPIKSSLTGRTYIAVGSTYATMDDQNAPNEDQ
jgi:hypothetical protein